MNQADSATIAVLSLAIALLAVFVGPLISWKIAKKQIEAASRTARVQMLGPIRQAWINELRELIAEVASSCLHYWQSGFEDRAEAEYKRITDIEHKIQLMINPKEDDHRRLVSHIRAMVESLSQGKDGDDAFFMAYETVMKTGKDVLKKEWNVVKET
jgi:hypothetical protein